MELLVALTGVFGSVLICTLLLYLLLSGEKMRMSKRVTAVVGASNAPIRQQELSLPLFQRFIKPLLGGLARIFSKYIPAARENTIEKKLREAGRPGNMSARELMAVKYLSCGACALLLKFLWSGDSSAQSFMMAVAGAVLGWLLPDTYLNMKITKRKDEIEKQLPEVLDLLTVCVEAGLGFDGAIMKVVEKLKGVLPAELHLALEETRMGKPRREALREMADRICVDDLSNFVGSIIMAEQLGISIGNVLRLQSREIRQKRRQRVEEQAMKAPIKMLIPMVAFIFPSLFVVLLGPAMLRIMRIFGK
jgi:tight adherence protein C